MKRGLVAASCGAAIAGALMIACLKSSSDPPSSGSPDAATPDGGDPGATPTVECTHPGAGKKLADGKCECPQSLVNFTGIWNGFYTCGENGQCVDRNKKETFVFTQTGNKIHADDTDDGGLATFVFDGILCGEYFVWSGGPTDKQYAECGVLRFTDANHYVKDSCYDYAGTRACAFEPDGGCAGHSGICTNTGAREPEEASAVAKVICN